MLKLLNLLFCYFNILSILLLTHHSFGEVNQPEKDQGTSKNIHDKASSKKKTQLKPKPVTTYQPIHAKKSESHDQNRFYLGLSAGYSINKAKESGFLETKFEKTINSKSTALAGSAAFQVEVGYIFNRYIRAGLAASFLPPSRLTIKSNSTIVGTLVGTDEIIEAGSDELLVSQVSSYGLMSNIYYHPLPPSVKNSDVFSPYIMTGAGLYVNHISDMNISSHLSGLNPGATSFLFNNSTANFAWQVGGGMMLNLFKNVGIDINYKFLDRGKVKTKDSFIMVPIMSAKGVGMLGGMIDAENSSTIKDLRSHQIMVGTIVRF